MILHIERRWKKEAYTIGRLYVDGAYFCNTLEDKDRGLKKTDLLSIIQSKKVYGETAIPTGTYPVTLDIRSPKYYAVSKYRNYCGGRMPRLLGVPGFDGILIHPGNTAADSAGCILCGFNTSVGRLSKSWETWKALYERMKAASDRGEYITIEIA